MQMTFTKDEWTWILSAIIKELRSADALISEADTYLEEQEECFKVLEQVSEKITLALVESHND